MMEKFKFTKEIDRDNRYSCSTINMEVETEMLPVVVREFATFLRACGFHFDAIMLKSKSLSEDEPYNVEDYCESDHELY